MPMCPTARGTETFIGGRLVDQLVLCVVCIVCKWSAKCGWDETRQARGKEFNRRYNRHYRARCVCCMNHIVDIVCQQLSTRFFKENPLCVSRRSNKGYIRMFVCPTNETSTNIVRYIASWLLTTTNRFNQIYIHIVSFGGYLYAGLLLHHLLIIIPWIVSEHRVVLYGLCEFGLCHSLYIRRAKHVRAFDFLRIGVSPLVV